MAVSMGVRCGLLPDMNPKECHHECRKATNQKDLDCVVFSLLSVGLLTVVRMKLLNYFLGFVVPAQMRRNDVHFHSLFKAVHWAQGAPSHYIGPTRSLSAPRDASS